MSSAQEILFRLDQEYPKLEGESTGRQMQFFLEGE
jgi:hypothetical protein